MEREKLERSLLEKEVDLKAFITPLVDLKRSVLCLETEKGLVMKTNE